MKLAILSLLFFSQSAQLTFADTECGEGQIVLIQSGSYVVDRIKCWNDAGKRTHYWKNTRAGVIRICPKACYMRVDIDELGSKNDKMWRRHRKSADCTGAGKKLCLELRGTVFNSSIHKECINTTAQCFM